MNGASPAYWFTGALQRCDVGLCQVVMSGAADCSWAPWAQRISRWLKAGCSIALAVRYAWQAGCI